MISAKEAANIAANYNISTARTLDSVENTITSAAAQGNTYVILSRHLIPHEVLSSLIDNGYHLEVYDGNVVVSWATYKNNGRSKKKINNIDSTPGLNLTTNDISNYHRLSSADDINNSYRDNRIKDITSSNVESWFTKYIYSDLDRFSNTISCGTKFTIKDGMYEAQWVVVGADTELNKGDRPLAKPHLSLIPVTSIDRQPMNRSSITTKGAYVGSDMYRSTIPAIVAALQKVLGSHLLARRVKLANSVGGGGKSNGNAYYTVYANLLCERQVFGKSKYENDYDIGDDTEALPGFKNYKNKIYGSSDFWLRSVCHEYRFVNARSDGILDSADANTSRGVRPLITIG